jgi:hypothetical protein
MKTGKNRDELRPEYTEADLGTGVRGKYYEDYKRAKNLVLLDPDVAKAFPDDKSVNEALKSLIRAARASVDLSDVS